MPSPHIVFAAFTLLSILAGTAYCAEAVPGSGAEPEQVMAIDILLLPDTAMIAAAQVLNVRVRERDPDGFAFDNTHVPHISLLHRFIRTSDLAKAQSAVAQTIAQSRPAGWQLRATRLESAPWERRAVLNIVIERTPDLARLQSALVSALAPIAVRNGTAGAFVQLPREPQASGTTVDYVRNFVPKVTGENFKPHITAGIGARKVIEEIRAGSFVPMTFGVADVAIFQLGDVGTARKFLWKSREPPDLRRLSR